MIKAFVASIERDEFCPKRGTGKTCSMTHDLYSAYLKHRRTIANYYTPFAEYMNITDILIGIIKEEIRDATISLTEFQHIMDELGHKQIARRIVRLMVSQSRKLELDINIDLQILKQAGNDMRDHVDYIFIPEKRHLNGLVCTKDRCPYPHHRIYVYSRAPLFLEPLRILKAENVGKLYDTHKITIDPIDIEKLEPYGHLFGMRRSKKKEVIDI